MKVESVNNPNVGSPTEWCLPVGTIITINDGVEDIDTVTTSSETCPGGTIWSGLVNLTSLENYTIALATVNVSGVKVHKEAGYVWFGMSDVNETCTNYCLRIGGICVDPGTHDVDLDCSEMNAMMGMNVGCDTRSYVEATFPLYCHGHTTFFPQDHPGTYTCDASTWNYDDNRFCTCANAYFEFTFTFQAP